MEPQFIISIPSGPVFDPRMSITLESLRQQSVSVQVALCDASDDPRCKELANEYRDIIRYRRHGPDNGQSAAINEGWINLSGRYYGWLNVDDYLAPNALELIGNHFENNPKADVVYGSSIMSRNGKMVGMHHEVRAPSNYIYRSNIISQPSCYVRKKSLFSVGLLNEDLHYTMDWELWARLMKSQACFILDESISSVVVLGEETKTAAFNYVRIKEIFSLVSRYSNFITAAKTLLVMGVHNIFEYSSIFKTSGTTTSLSKRIRNMGFKFSKGSKESRQQEITVNLFHYNKNDVSLATFIFPEERIRKVLDEGKTIGSFEGCKISLPISLKSGDQKAVTIVSQGSKEDILLYYSME